MSPSQSQDNPCPACSAGRDSIEAPCPACGWSPVQERTEYMPATRPRFRFGRFGYAFWLLLFATHGGAVWWAATHVSPGFLIMEGGEATVRESIANLLVLILTLPLVWGAYFLRFQGWWLVASVGLNSALWATLILWIARCCVRFTDWTGELRGD